MKANIICFLRLVRLVLFTETPTALDTLLFGNGLQANATGLHVVEVDLRKAFGCLVVDLQGNGKYDTEMGFEEICPG